MKKWITENWKIVLGLILVLAIVLIIRAWMRSRHQGADPDQLDKGRVLSRGSQGPEVEVLQRWINTKLAVLSMNPDEFTEQIPPLEIDGKFGPLTEGALILVTGRGSTTLEQLGL